MKRFDLMNGIQVRGTYAVSQACIPHLKGRENPHILTLSPTPARDVTIVGAGRPKAGGREGRGRWIDAGVTRLGVFKQPQDACTRSQTASVRPVQG